MKTKGEVIRFKLELMAAMMMLDIKEQAQELMQQALDLCDTITEQMPEEEDF